MTPLELAVQVGEMFDQAGIEYAVGGSVASSLFGEPRSTLDIDFALRGTNEAFRDVLERAAADFYVPTEAAVRAIASSDSFNLLHHASGIKIDLFVLGDALIDRRQIEHRVRVAVGAGDLWVTSPIDIVLRKLWWFRMTDGGSQRQWRDVVALLRVSSIDHDEIRSVAVEVGLEDLADRAIAESVGDGHGASPDPSVEE